MDMNRAKHVLWSALLSLLLVTSAYAADEAVIDVLQTDVMIAKDKAVDNESKIKLLQGGLPTEQAARISGDAALQEQIDTLQSELAALTAQPPTASNDDNHGRTSGLIGFTDIVEDCEINEYGLDCENKRLLHFSILPGMQTWIEAVNIETISVNGEPQDIENTVTLTLSRDVNEDGTDDKITFFMEIGEFTDTFSISAADPLYSSGDDEGYNRGDFLIKAERIAASQILVTGNFASVKSIKTESIGAIVEATVVPYNASDTETTVTVRLGNFGDLESDYIVTLTDFSDGLTGPPSQAVRLLPYTETNLTFDLHRPNGFSTDTHEFTVTLKSTTGRIYDYVTVIASP
jgi:male gamete fusion factor